LNAENFSYRLDNLDNNNQSPMIEVEITFQLGPWIAYRRRSLNYQLQWVQFVAEGWWKLAGHAAKGVVPRAVEIPVK
jgi:hypothetical protein